MTTPGNQLLGRMAYCLVGEYPNPQFTLDNIQEFYANQSQTDFYLPSMSSVQLSNKWNIITIPECDNLTDLTELWYQKYKQLPVLESWLLARGAIHHMLQIQHTINAISQTRCLAEYDLFILSSWQARYQGPIDFLDHWPMHSMLFSRQMMIYGPSLKWLVTPLNCVSYLANMIVDMYVWLQTSPTLHFPWGLHPNWPATFNWSLVIAQYLSTRGIICHHHDWPISLHHDNYKIHTV